MSTTVRAFMDDQQAPDPMQFGRTIYAARGAGFLALQSGSETVTQFTGLTFSSLGTSYSIGNDPPVASTGDYSSIVDFAVVQDPISGREQVIVLRQSGGALKLETFACPADSKGTIENSVTLSSIASPRIAGVVAAGASNSSQLLIAGYESGALSVSMLDAQTGNPSAQCTVTMTNPGPAAAATVIRTGASATLVLVTLASGALYAAAVPVSSLGANALTASQISLADSVDAASIQATATRVIASSSDQQVALCYSDTAGNATIAVLGMNNGAISVIQSVQVPVDFAPADRNTFKIAAADLNADGVDEIAVAWPATYGKISGSVAMVLFAMDPKAGTLSKAADYVASANMFNPLASVDLSIAAGVFGNGVTMGILVISCGASFDDLESGKAEIFAGVVGVDPVNTTLPSYTNVPAVLEGITTVGTTTSDAPGIYACAVDMTGLSVVLGEPTFTQVLGNQQIIAIIGAPPYDSSIASGKPTLTFTQSENMVQGLNVATNKMWTTSSDFGLNLGIGPVQLAKTITDTYGTNFDKTDDTTTATNVQVTATITDDDWIIMMANDYMLWEYPVYQSAVDANPSGSLLVVFPTSTSAFQTTVPAHQSDLGYRRPYENGCLLSYIGAVKDGFDPSQPGLEMFDPQQTAVTEDFGGATVVFDESNSDAATEGQGYTLHNTAGDSAHFAASTTLFDYLPVTFGFNLSASESYSDTEMQTSTITRTSTMTITVNGGSVRDVEYDYDLITYVYRHSVLNCLTVGYDVVLKAPGWADIYNVPLPRLMKPFRSSENVVYAAFTRSVTFSGTAAIVICVEIFNCCLTDELQAACECYEGLPAAADGSVPASAVQIGVQQNVSIPALGRATVTFPWPDATQNQCVTVKVWDGNNSATSAEIGWNVYPESYFPNVSV